MAAEVWVKTFWLNLCDTRHQGGNSRPDLTCTDNHKAAPQGLFKAYSDDHGLEGWLSEQQPKQVHEEIHQMRSRLVDAFDVL